MTPTMLNYLCSVIMIIHLLNLFLHVIIMASPSKKLKDVPSRSFFRIYNDPVDRIYWKQCYDYGTDSVFAISYNNEGCMTVHRLPTTLIVFEV